MRQQKTFSILLFLWIGAAPAFAQLEIRDATFQSIIDSANTADVDLSTQSPGIILQTGTNTNLALNRPVAVRYGNQDPSKVSTRNDAQLMVDGRVASNSFFELLPGQEGTQVRIDLQAIRVVNRVRTRVYPGNSVDFRIRGYTIYTGLDTLSYRKVKQVPDNEAANTDDFFDPDTAQYILITIDRQDPNLTSPVSTLIGEIEVYGTGYLSSGNFTCVVRDVGTRVNWARASWSGVTPPGTRIGLQVRTGEFSSVNSSWSEWSDTIFVSNSLFTVFEPRQYMQYRVILQTFSVETPRLDEVVITYDTLLVADWALARISPQFTPILKEATFHYEVRVQMNALSRGVDSLTIGTDFPVVVSSVSIDGTTVPAGVAYRPGAIAVGFPSTITTNSTIVVQMVFVPYQLSNRFPSRLVSNALPGNPQTVDVIRGPDGVEEWSIVTTGVPDRVIVGVTADPNPFTPNGDGRNDVTYISFIITNLLNERPLRVKIYDVTGRLVRTLRDLKTMAYGFVESNAIPWDGRDDTGRRLPPGLYLCQVYVEVDGLSPAVVTKTISLAY